ncbi:MAG: response regulator [Blastocatellia bacterium]
MVIANPKILVVDDEAGIRFALQDYLTAKGMDVACATSAGEADVMLSRNNYSVAIVDLRLIGEIEDDGIVLLSRIRRHSPMTRTVLISANMTTETAQRARDIGVDLVLSKPVPLHEVAAGIQRLTGEGRRDALGIRPGFREVLPGFSHC